MTNDGRKKRNTAIFITLASIANIVLMLAFFLIGVVILNLVVSPDDQGALSIGFTLVFAISAGLSFFIYSRFVKWYMKKVNTEENFAPIFTSKKKAPRQPKD